MSQPRFDVYGPVHKGLRFLMTEFMYKSLTFCYTYLSIALIESYDVNAITPDVKISCPLLRTFKSVSFII
jgi:hypothetical protein